MTLASSTATFWWRQGRAGKNGHVVAVVDGEFVCKHLQLRAGRMKLKAANPSSPNIVPREGQVVELWGVVTASVKTMSV